MQQVIIFVTLLLTLTLFLWGRWRYDIVAVGASCAFLTPIGHQSNTLVMEPAGYKFGDYWRMGLPLEVLIVLAGVPLILWRWPF